MAFVEGFHCNQIIACLLNTSGIKTIDTLDIINGFLASTL